MGRKYLDEWIERLLKENKDIEHNGTLSAENIKKYQERKIRETLKIAVDNSPFYSRLYGGLDIEKVTLDNFHTLPFTCPDNVRHEGLDMVCTPISEISRIVTLKTSGTTGEPKRIYFTEADQRLTVDYFREGMQYLTAPGERIFIGMPHNVPASIGELLRTGLEEMGAVTTYDIREKNIDCIVGIPQIVAKEAAEYEGTDLGRALKQSVKKVLLSADYVSDENVKTIENAWDCTVYEHYGMTEMGLGCAVSCGEGRGYHIRENDLYLEIVDPESGETLPDGEFGEVVFTTLTRRGMPFIRYRTGDISRIFAEPCLCGSVLRRLDKVKERK